jgi:peptide chain release factor 2
MGEAEGEATVVADAEAALEKLRAEAARRELESLLSGEADANDCYLEVHAGAGGTEAQDWAEMLLRMYVRWAEAHGYKTEWLEESGGEEAGLKSATVRINGPDAYGWLKTESGVHRLVRISPFDSNARRGRPARQQDGQRGPDHPHAERHRRAVPERALTAPEPRPRLFNAARQAL